MVDRHDAPWLQSPTKSVARSSTRAAEAVPPPPSCFCWATAGDGGRVELGMLEPVRGPMAGPPLPGFRCFAGGVEAAAVDADRARLPIAGGATAAAAAEGSTAEGRRGAAAGLGERDAVVGERGVGEA